MFSAAELFAQKTSPAFSWYVAGEIPPFNGQSISLGLGGPVTGIHNNKLFVAGGANFPDSMPWQGGKKQYYDRVYIFSKIAGHISLVNKEFLLPDKLAYAATCTTPDGVFYAGGENGSGILANAFLLKWDKGKMTMAIEKLPDLPLAITNASAACNGELVFITGGETANAVSKKCWLLNLKHKQVGWQEFASLPLPASHAVLAATKKGNDLKLYFIGGRSKMKTGISELYSSIYEYNAFKNEWKLFSNLPYPLSAGTGAVSGTSQVFLFGGERGTTFSKVEALLATINMSNDEIGKQDLVRQKNQLLATHPGFSREILILDLLSGECKPAAELPFEAPVTTSACWWDGCLVIPSGEIKAGIRSPKIWMAKTLPWLK